MTPFVPLFAAAGGTGGGDTTQPNTSTSGGTTHGHVRVYAGSRLLKTVSLRTSRTVTKRVIPITSFSTAYTGTIKVVVATSGKPVRLEGIATPTR